MKYQPLVGDALDQLRCDVEASVDAANDEFKAVARRECEHRNALIDLLMGTGAFADAYDTPAAPSALTVGNETVQISAASLGDDLRTKQSPYTPLDAELARDRVAAIARLEPTHPVARHWRVVRNACYTGDTEVPQWPDIPAAITAGEVAIKAAADEAAWQAEAAAWREAEAKRVADAEARAKRAAEFRAASLQNTPSGYRQDNSASIVTSSETPAAE